MKSKSFALTIISILLLLVVTGSSLVQFGEANWLLPPQKEPASPILVIDSPVRNETKNTSNVDLNCTVYVGGWNKYYSGDYLKVGYSLDKNPYVWFIVNDITPEINEYEVAVFHFSMKLTGLTDGAHNLTASAQHFGNYSPAPYKVERFTVRGYSPEISFSIETHTIPEFPSWALLPFFVMATIAVILYRRRFEDKFRSS